MKADRQELADLAANLAVQGVYIGTSSWKYPGWFGMLYDRACHEYRGKFAMARFNRECLTEYRWLMEPGDRQGSCAKPNASAYRVGRNFEEFVRFHVLAAS
jgi:hypothetical protein